MNYKSSGANEREPNRKPSRHCKLRLLLSGWELDWLEGALEASGAWSRRLLIAEALRAGLASTALKIQSNRRPRRIDARVPRKLALRLKQVAAENRISQQHLLRLFLFQYLTAAPWKHAQNEGEGGVSCS